jgi:hypothetical protein
VPARHRSLRAAFDYSWQLLAQDVREIFAQLAAFHGGFTLAAARSFAITEGRHMTLMCEKSLLCREGERYPLHPMLTRFAAEKLAADPARNGAPHERHATFYLGFLTGQGRKISPACGHPRRTLEYPRSVGLGRGAVELSSAAEISFYLTQLLQRIELASRRDRRFPIHPGSASPRRGSQPNADPHSL